MRLATLLWSAWWGLGSATTVTAIAPIAAADEIELFIPGIGEEERALRAKLRAYRNAATALVGSTGSANARARAWMAIEIVTDWLYRPADNATLQEIARFANRLTLTAVQAEALKDEGICA